MSDAKLAGSVVGPSGGSGCVFVNAPKSAAWSARATDSWLQLDFGSEQGVGPGLASFSVGANPGGPRVSQVEIAWHGSRGHGSQTQLSHTVEQQSSVAAQAQSDSVLQLTFPTVPRVMELGIAAKFAAQEIEKLPGIFRIIGLLIAEVVVLLAGVATVVARTAVAAPNAPSSPDYYEELAMPLPCWELPGLLGQLLPLPVVQDVPITSIVIGEQTVLTMVYLALEVLGVEQ